MVFCSACFHCTLQGRFAIFWTSRKILLVSRITANNQIDKKSTLLDFKVSKNQCLSFQQVNFKSILEITLIIFVLFYYHFVLLLQRARQSPRTSWSAPNSTTENRRTEIHGRRLQPQTDRQSRRKLKTPLLSFPNHPSQQTFQHSSDIFSFMFLKYTLHSLMFE